MFSAQLLYTIFTGTDIGPRLPPSLMHPDVGEVDLAYHVHVPRSDRSITCTISSSDCAGHASAVSSLRSSGSRRDDCTVGFGSPMDHVSSVPSTWCGQPPGMIGSQLLGESQIRWSSAGIGTNANHAQSLTKIDGICLSCSISGPSSRRHTPVVREFLPEKNAVRCPTPAAAPWLNSMTNFTSLGKLARVVARG